MAVEVHDQEQNLPKMIEIIETNGMKAVPIDDALAAYGIITLTATH